MSDFERGVAYGRMNPVYFSIDEMSPLEGQRVYAVVFDGDERWELDAVYSNGDFFNGDTLLPNVEKWIPLPAVV